MPTSSISGGGITSPAQVGADVIQRSALNTTTAGQAVITKVIAGTGISITQTGVDAGTGDVTVNAAGGGASYVETSTVGGGITGVINGVNTVFVLPSTPAAGSLSVFIRGSRQTRIAGTHFALAVATITFVDAPQVGDIIDAVYAL